MNFFILLFILMFASPAVAESNVEGRAGVYTGYAFQDRIGSQELANGLMIGGSAGVRWLKRWELNFGYQWMKSERENESAFLHSFRLMPYGKILSRGDHEWGAEMGFGYQVANLQGFNPIRQFEWMVGPRWTWSAWNPIQLETRLQYVHTFYQGGNTGLQQLAVSIGFGIVFDGKKSIAPPPSADVDQDGDVDTSKDSDEDRVADVSDFCPDSDKSSIVDEMGCPEESVGRGVIEGIEFEFQSARLIPSSIPILEAVAKDLNRYPNLFFRIESYASLQGTYSQVLSEARAIGIVNILVAMGVPEHRLYAFGLGSAYPLVASFPGALTLNDRVEIKWMSSSQERN